MNSRSGPNSRPKISTDSCGRRMGCAETLRSDRVPDRGKRGVRVGADGLNGRQADHDDQGEHDRVLDSSWAVLGNQDSFVSAIRGWELPPAVYGTLHSFSDPTLPRVMGFNVLCTAQDEPQISSFCFTWFGHELGHTKSYLIETILHVLGLSLTPVHGGYTRIMQRYGRRLPIRTLLQIPCTHLYEWVLLTRALEQRFSALPWTVSDDPIAPWR